jgi:nucleoside-diphosphate-sugar epimerase
MSGRLAVAGANGFVGRNLVAAAAGLGWDVVGIVRSEPAARVVRDAGGRAAVLGAWDPGPLAAALAGARAAVHLAQIGAERGGSTYEDANLGSTRRLIEAARRGGVGRIVYFSGLGAARYGLSRRCTNRYFLSKLVCEVELYRSGLEAVVFRPSYVLGPGDGLVRMLLAQMAEGVVERPGDGSYRMQPIGVGDAAAAVLAALDLPRAPAVYDLVGPEAVAFRDLIERLAGVARRLGRPAEYRVREVAVEEVDRRAASGGYHGMLPDEVDCLLCDEVSDHRPLEALLGRPPTTLDAALLRAAGGP